MEPTPNTAPRQLVLLCDGTNNNLTGRRNDTNLVKLAELLAASPDPQRLLCYDPGVGNPGELPGATTWDQLQRRLERIGGLAFGRGVFENMAESYLFLMRNYRPGDQIYIFGFSRGAFTARSVAGLINLFGILPAQLESMVPTLLHVYFSSRDDDGAWQAIAAQVLRVFGSAPQRPNVHFIGVWDTVASVGMPPFGARFTALPQPENKRYLHIRQALALDEHRSQFEPRLYARNNGPFTTADGSTGSLVQLWFPGAHCDVGGAYLPAESVLSDNALAWLASEAVGEGLRLQAEGAPLDNEPAVHRALAQVLQQDDGTRQAQAHSELLDTPLWALTGLTVRDTTQVHLDDGGVVPLQAVAHQPAGGAPAVAPPRRLKGGALVLLLTFVLVPLLMVLHGTRLLGLPLGSLSEVWDALRQAGPALQANADFQSWQLFGWWTGLGPGNLRSAWGALGWDLVLIAAYAYALSWWVSSAFARLVGWRCAGDGARLIITVLGWALPLAVGSDLAENLVTAALLASLKLGWWALAAVLQWVLPLLSLAKFIGLAGALVLVVAGLLRPWRPRPAGLG